MFVQRLGKAVVDIDFILQLSYDSLQRLLTFQGKKKDEAVRRIYEVVEIEQRQSVARTLSRAS